MTIDTPFRPTVLVLGARGRLGLAATQAFSQRGWRVLAQTRRAVDVAPMPGVHWLVQTIDSAAQRRELVARARQLGGAQVLVHGLNPSRYARPAWEAEAMPLLHAGMAVAQALQATLMLPGNVYAYGRQLPAELTEGTPVRPDSAMGRIRQDMEDTLRHAAQRGDLRSTVVRAGNFYGQGRGTWLDQAMLTGIRRGRLTFPGPLDVVTPWAWLPDLAQTFVALAERRAGLDAFEALHFQGHTLSGHDWVQALQPIAEAQGWLQTGHALRVGTLPWGLIGAVGWFKPEWAALAEGRHLWTRPHRLVGQRLAACIGHEPHTPFTRALSLTLIDLGLLAQARGARSAAGLAPV